MYPEVRAAVAADAGPDFRAPGFDLAAHREEVRRASLELPREEVAEVRGRGRRRRAVPPLRPGRRRATASWCTCTAAGFVFNDIDVHDGFSRRLANRCGRPVLSIDYRRPPEHRFPAAPDDVDTALGWLGRQDLPGRWAVHGDSAGANLALVAALRNPGLFAAVALVYPFLEPRAGHPSYDEGAASGFDPAEARWYWEQYADESAWDDPDLAPLRSTRLATLPPTLVATAEHDPLRDEGEVLARRLAEEGVETVGVRCLGQTHGFYRHEQFTASEPLVRQVSGFVDQHLA